MGKEPEYIYSNYVLRCLGVAIREIFWGVMISVIFVGLIKPMVSMVSWILLRSVIFYLSVESDISKEIEWV
jgi:hypothetical protein